MTTKRHCSILEFGRGASNQAVVPGIIRPLHATGENEPLSSLRMMSIHREKSAKASKILLKG